MNFNRILETVGPVTSFLAEYPVIGISPFQTLDPGLVVAVARAGALGVLDLGSDPDAWPPALAQVASKIPGEFGVRVPRGLAVDPSSLPAAVKVIIVPAGAPRRYQRPVLVEVTSLAEARAAEAAGAVGLIAKGSESGGEVGEETAFVLLQRLVDSTELPIWVQGGIGLYTAAACIAGGAKGVVLDAQLALVKESSLPQEIKAAVSAMDGSETIVLAGHRVFSRPDLPVAKLVSPSVEEVRAMIGARKLASDLLPVGQDGAFARPLADRFRTAGGVVKAIRRAIATQVREARAQRALSADAPLAQKHHLRYPIFQGPMTRVSDRAAFAEAVAEGLPQCRIKACPTTPR